MADPLRGDIWLANLDPARGHEQAGRRPVLIASADIYNGSPRGMTVVVPLTTMLRRVRIHVRPQPPEGGLVRESAILCDAIRSIPMERLIARFGSVSPVTMRSVEESLRALLGL